MIGVYVTTALILYGFTSLIIYGVYGKSDNEC